MIKDYKEVYSRKARQWSLNREVRSIEQVETPIQEHSYERHCHFTWETIH